MLNIKETSDPKLVYKSTPKKTYVDKRQDPENNNYNIEKLNDKLSTLIMVSDDNKHEIEFKMLGIERKLENQIFENEELKTQISSLNQKIEHLNKKIINFSDLDTKLESITLENKRLFTEILHLKGIVADSEKRQHSESIKHTEDLKNSISIQIKKMTETVEESYMNRGKHLEKLIRKISSNEYSKKQKHISINEGKGNSSQGFDNVSVSNDGSEEGSSEYINNDSVQENDTDMVKRKDFKCNFKTKEDSIDFEPTKSSVFPTLTSINPICTPTTNTQSKLSFNTYNRIVDPIEVKNSSAGGNKASMFGDNIFGNPSPVYFPKSAVTESQQTSNNFQLNKPSIFASSKPVNSSLFSKSIEKQSFDLASKPSELFGSSFNVPSFGTLAASGEPSFGSASETKWQGGSKLFSKALSKAEGDSVKEDEYNEHDPEFKPIIELPPLIEIVRDDNDKTVLFKNRCKLYRYFNEEWKERGVGEMKLLRSSSDGLVSLLMRREQIHKVCCNQRVSRDSHKLQPMGNDKSACWIAPDFSDGESTMEKFAVKFSDKSIMDEFTHALTDAQSSL